MFKKFNFAEIPGGRKIHRGYIPSMGGLTFIFAAFFGMLSWLSFEEIMQSRYFLVALAIMFSVGIRDDLMELSAGQKLLGQCIPAFFIISMADIRISGFYGFLGIYEIPYVLSIIITFFLLIVLTNSFNLIDGADGLAGSLSTISFAVLGIWFHFVGLHAYSVIAFTLVGGVLSFLVFNWHPAKIFMGDTGSLSLGFALTVFVILFVDKNGTMSGWEGPKLEAPIAAGLGLMIVPIYDTIRIFVKRILKGKSPLKPDKSHVHHFLIRMGLGHDRVALTLGGITCLFIALPFLLSDVNDHILFPFLVLLAVALGLWMDSKTLKYVKANILTTPPFSEKLKTKTKEQLEKNPIISNGIIKKDTLNMN
ncbi:MraY family glycosyltransferase [Lunatibacter salilacus]|uniref:MraY family glycosyltransferase n=1 Tax=Lunatibacter salilacus TaxID=2483804 RepID=UPI001F22601C|nr:MraY family glycosyltransferase [Lunatibacter salilacus]